MIWQVRAAGGLSSARRPSKRVPILDAMERGDFYASTGVELTDYQVTPKAMTVTVKTNAFARYRVHFIGRGGAC